MSTGSGARRIGLISDTHGLLRPEVFKLLDSVELILHAGDVGGAEILEDLALIAPVLAVAGNTDPPDEPRLKKEHDLEIGGVRVHVSHGHELGRPDPAALLVAYDADVLVYGHTHQQLIHQEGKRLVVNPGAAGARRFSLPASVAILTIVGGAASAEILDI